MEPKSGFVDAAFPRQELKDDFVRGCVPDTSQMARGQASHGVNAGGRRLPCRLVGAGEIAGTKLTFFPDEPNPCEAEALLDLADCKFEYGESREALPGSMSAQKFSSILTAVRSDDVTFLFGEVRI
jgi:hypothetical protein